MDITNPSCGKILNVQHKELKFNWNVIKPIHFSKNLLVMSTDFFLPSNDQPIILDAEQKAEMIRQYIHNVDFGKLDYLFIDTPPTTSEELLTIMNIIESKNTTYILITQPSDVSDNAVQKSVRYLVEEGVTISGIIDNMYGHICSKCGHHDKLFIQEGMSTRDMAEKYGIPYLGGIPTGLIKKGNRGEIILDNEIFYEIAEKIIHGKGVHYKKKFPRKRSIYKRALRMLKVLRSVH